MDDPLVPEKSIVGPLVGPILVAGLTLAACGSDANVVFDEGTGVVATDPEVVADDGGDKVTPPATVRLDLGDGQRTIGDSMTFVVAVSAPGELDDDASYSLILDGTGVARVAEQQHAVDPTSIAHGGVQSIDHDVVITGGGVGEIVARLVAVAADGSELWATADHLQILADADDVFVGRAGLLALREQQLRRDLEQGRVTPEEFDDLLTELRGGGATSEITVVGG